MKPISLLPTGPLSATRTVVAALSLFLAAGNPATAAFIYEGFDYSTGSALDALNGGAGFSNNWASSTDYVIGSGSLAFKNLQTSGKDVGFSETNLAVSEASRSVLFSGFGNDGTTSWMSFLIQPDSDPTNGVFTFGVPGLLIGKGSVTDGNFYELGNHGLASTVPIVERETTFVAVEFQFNADPKADDTATVFFDPTPGLSAPDVTGLAQSNFNFDSAVGAVFLDAANGMAFSFDELRMGASYADVSPASATAPVPEPCTLVLLTTGCAAWGTARGFRSRQRQRR